MKIERSKHFIAAFVFVLLTIGGATRFVAAQQTGANDKLKAEIEQVVREMNDAFARRDAAAFGRLLADEGYLYDVNGYTPMAQLKPMLLAMLGSPEAAKSKTSYDAPTDFNIIALGADAAVANFKLTEHWEDANGKKLDYYNRISQIFVRRDGRWQIVARHDSELKKPLEAVSAGMPAGWMRTPIGKGANYALTVDQTVKHAGKASAHIKAACADNDGDWTSLAQGIKADEFRGRRVRLTGWLKTDSVNKAGLWLRVDGRKNQFGFDNMDNRAVTGTTDWKQYSVVLDVPAEAVNIYFGILVQGAGSVWADDFKIETVGSTVASTNLMTAEAMKQEFGTESKPVENAKPVNLDFESGAVAKIN